MATPAPTTSRAKCWDTIKDIQKQDLQRHFSKPKLRKLRQIAIDEIAVGQGHRYLTVVLDLVSGAVVFAGEGKGADALAPFWKRLRPSQAKIKAVATDMSLAYILAVREHLPRAVHVFDHFHVIKLFNEKLSDFRRELCSVSACPILPQPAIILLPVSPFQEASHPAWKFKSSA